MILIESSCVSLRAQSDEQSIAKCPQFHGETISWISFVSTHRTFRHFFSFLFFPRFVFSLNSEILWSRRSENKRNCERMNTMSSVTILSRKRRYVSKNESLENCRYSGKKSISLFRYQWMNVIELKREFRSMKNGYFEIGSKTISDAFREINFRN